MTIPTILTLSEAMSHLRLTSDDSSDLQLKLDAATQLVCEYIADRQPEDEDWIAEIEGWDSGDPPPVIKLAVLTQVGEFYRFRGDDVAADKPAASSGGDDLSDVVKRLLKMYRSPSIA